ncbi:MAG TPA: UDP-glucose 4-epimerase GalE [Tepidisphaeraceae bacterium]|jgi:UDP-glucose 4-epimerase|nr:UDP-glucose 4-epimerase GalE [Tepidisphaeraceae bacterium]
MNVLVAGGAGYIGSHTVKRLKEAGHKPVIYDNLSRGHQAVAKILDVPVVWADLNDSLALMDALRTHKIDTVMHFAAFAYVGESVDEPLRYYQNNVATTVNVLRVMQEAGVNRFVFSSTCATYGDPPSVPITEDMPKNPVSPYGHSKLMVERILMDLANGKWTDFKFAALRYFNASGCSMDGSIGEDHDPETHLIPVVLQAIMGVRPGITVFGTDYPTPDGTNVRDYIHVEDLADAHILAMEKLDSIKKVFANLGTGKGFSVKEIIATAEQVTGKKAPVTYGPRRPGDAIALYANPKLAKDVLGWEAKHKDPLSIVQSAWNWHKDHPRGYER